MKKISFLFTLLCASVMAFAQTPSGELFATYQKQGDRFYKGGNEAVLTADYFDWNVDYYIVSCGDSIWFRAITTEDRNFTAGWQTQLRVWNASGTYDTQRSEVQTNAGGGTKNCYTSMGRSFVAKTANDLNMHLFVDWEGYCVTNTFAFNRASINNPIVDAVAPTINPEEVTMTEEDGNLVFTFGEVTADDEYFFYVADKDHNVGGVSLSNKVYIAKPTVEDGTKYAFKCYAVDFNGNKSAYKEFSLAMPFDPAIDLAFNKPSTAGIYQDANTPDRANNGNADNFWTCFGQGDSEDWWWKVDLGNCYEITDISIHFNDCWGTYGIYGSKDDAVWSPIVENEPSASNETKTYESLNFSGRYLKVVSAASQIGIREFNVYGTGVSPNPTTAIIDANESNKATKLIENGTLIIVKDGVRYNVLGSKL